MLWHHFRTAKKGSEPCILYKMPGTVKEVLKEVERIGTLLFLFIAL